MQDEAGSEPFARAYRFVRQHLADGRLEPGTQIKVGRIAADLKVSPTPVREALARLAGERLVVDRRHLGYFAAELDERTLTELYAIQLGLLIAGLNSQLGRAKRRLDRSRDAQTGDVQALHAAPLSAPAMTDLIARMSGNEEVRAMNDWLNARLDPVRAHEATLIAAAVSDSLEAAVRGGQARQITTALRRYFASCRLSAREMAVARSSRTSRI